MKITEIGKWLQRR